MRRSELLLPTEYVEPQGDIGETLAGIWQRVLNIDLLGFHDDFFEIGGDSLGASVIAGEIETRLGCKFSPSLMVSASTVAAQAEYIQSQREESTYTPSNLILYNRNGSRPPLFIVHGGIGFTLYDRRFLEGFDKDQPIGFIEAIGFDGKEPPLDRIESMASRYLEAVQQVFPAGGWRIAGNCAGSLVALEMCRQAEASGTPADRLFLIDPKPDLFRSPEQKKQLTQEKGRRHGLKLFLLRIRKVLFRRGDDAETFEAELNHRQDRQFRIEHRLKMLAGGERGEMISGGASYSADAVRKVSRLFSLAVDRYEAPVWTGTTYILQTKGRHRYWKVMGACLPNAAARSVPHTHRTLFIEGLPDIQKFLNDALSPHARDIFS